MDIKEFYTKFKQRQTRAKEVLGRPLTLTEKIIFSHLADGEVREFERGKDHIFLKPDRVAVTDIAAQTPFLLFMNSGKTVVETPTNLHLDHLIVAEEGADEDLANSNHANREVFDFLTSAGHKFGVEVWKPGSGIVHQVILENHAIPGGLLIGSDSHTPNAGGLGMLAIGIGGSDALDAMLGLPWELLFPEIVGVRLVGKLDPWVSGKDIVLKMLELMTVRGGTNKVIEYFGPGVESLSCTAQATITNMGAEMGATTSIFPFHDSMREYLAATHREEVGELADLHREFLNPDDEVTENPENYYDQFIEIDLDKLEPYVSGPYSPDKSRPLSQFIAEVENGDFSEDICVALVGSCTNSSFEDLGRASSIAVQAMNHESQASVNFIASPGSSKVLATAEKAGYIDDLVSFGATIMANACGPCIGQWKRKDPHQEENVIISSFNRNFRGRNDGNTHTQNFLMSPELVTAMAISGKLNFNPLKDKIEGSDGGQWHLDPPSAKALPDDGFVEAEGGIIAPPSNSDSIEITIDPESDRLEAIAPFNAWNGEDLKDLLVLVKAKGKCTTDSISPSGPWLRFRGHLSNLSKNLLLRAENAFTSELGKGRNILTGEEGIEFYRIAADYKSKAQDWVIFGDYNYGEGSSREHAALTPRFMGCRAVVAKSIARIAETNLKRHGVLPLILKDPADFDKVREDDRVSIVGLTEIAPRQNLTVRLEHSDGSPAGEFEVSHALSDPQIEWFKAGSSINSFRVKAH